MNRTLPGCSYAARKSRAVTVEDGWLFCDYHRTEHRLIKAGVDLPDLPEYRLPRAAWLHPYGTDAAVRRHHRAKTPLCGACRVADRARKARRWAAGKAAA